MAGMEVLIGLFGVYGVFFGFATGIAGLVYLLIRSLIAKRDADRTRHQREPVRSVPARLRTKRTAPGVQGRVETTWYFATFEEQSGDFREVRMYRNDFGKLTEGEIGKLTYQGAWYIGFRPRGRRR